MTVSEDCWPRKPRGAADVVGSVSAASHRENCTKYGVTPWRPAATCDSDHTHEMKLISTHAGHRAEYRLEVPQRRPASCPSHSLVIFSTFDGFSFLATIEDSLSCWINSTPSMLSPTIFCRDRESKIWILRFF